MNSLLIVLFILATVFFVTFVFVSANNYKKRFEVDYNMKNMFPYEFNYQGTFKDNFVGNLALLFTSVTGIIFYSLFYKYAYNGMVMVLLICGVISSVIIPFITLLPIKFLKWHFVIDALFFISVLFTYLGIALANLMIFRDNSGVLYLILAIFGFLLSAFDLILIINPKLSKWANLEKVDNGNGNFSYQRPKFFPLAFTEWLFYLSYIFAIALSLFTYLIIK